jgi:hypothetical protein
MYFHFEPAMHLDVGSTAARLEPTYVGLFVGRIKRRRNARQSD